MGEAVTGFNRGFCNAYGSENKDGQAVLVGGLLAGQNRVATQWTCDRRPEFRGRWVCDNGHRSNEPVELCRQHWLEFTGSHLVPAPLRRDVQTCPRCASLADSPETQPKVRVRLEAVS
jgi:hypothetical protein